MKEKIENWFYLGKFQEAIEGNGDYLVPDHLYGAHNQAIVLSELIVWSQKNNQIEAISSLFIRILKLYFCNDFAAALRLLINYHYACVDTGEKLPISSKVLASIVNDSVVTKFKEVSSSGEIRSLLITVKKYFPGVG